MAGDDSWVFRDGNYARINGYGGDYDEEDWLIFPAINLDNYTQEILSLYYESRFPDPSVTGLEIFYSNNYQLDPSSTNWEEFASANSELDSNKSTDNSETDLYNLQVDLSGIDGANVTVGIKYTSIDQDPNHSRRWLVAYPIITATETTSVTVGGDGSISDDTSFYRLRAENLGFLN